MCIRDSVNGINIAYLASAEKRKACDGRFEQGLSHGSDPEKSGKGKRQLSYKTWVFAVEARWARQGGRAKC